MWHCGEGTYCVQMICGDMRSWVLLIYAACNPSEHRSLIWFTIWSSVMHALIMALHLPGQSIFDAHETGHLLGDVPAFLLVALVLWLLLPAKQVRVATA